MIRGTRGEDDRDWDEDMLLYTPSSPRVRAPRIMPEIGKESSEEKIKMKKKEPTQLSRIIKISIKT